MEERWIESAFVNIERDIVNAKTLFDWEYVAMNFENIASSVLLVCKTQDDYCTIFDKIHSKAMEGFNSGNAKMATEMYDDNVIVVDMESNNRYYGVDHIRQSVRANIERGEYIEFKAIRKVFHEAGENRFSAYIEFETTNMVTGLVTEGFFQQLYYKKQDQWKCVFERNGAE